MIIESEPSQGYCNIITALSENAELFVHRLYRRGRNITRYKETVFGKDVMRGKVFDVYAKKGRKYTTQRKVRSYCSF